MTLIYFSPVPWDSYEQRPHYVVRDFLAAGGTQVVWINPYPARLPGWRDLARADWRHAAIVQPRPANVEVVNIGGLPVDPLPGGSRINQRLLWRHALGRLAARHQKATRVIGIGRPTALARFALDTIEASMTFYDAMDDFPEFYTGLSRASTARVEREIASRVTRLVASSSHLVEKFRAMGLAPMLVPNAFDMRLLPPYDAVRSVDPHYGFIGALGRWFDWTILSALADEVRPAPVSIVGPRASRGPSRLPPNVTLHAPCTQSEGVRWLGRFSTGLIPFTRDRLTAGIDPIKFYQYRGAGLPILSTRFGEMASRSDADGVFFLDGPGGVAAAVRAARAYRPAVSDLVRFRAAHDWSTRFRNAALWQHP